MRPEMRIHEGQLHWTFPVDGGVTFSKKSPEGTSGGGVA
jgi:hypothetical protein